MHGMNRLDYNNLKNIIFRSYNLTTSKDYSIKTSVSGITILEHSSISNQESAIRDELSIHLGRTLLDIVKNDENKVEEKDLIKLNSLPKAEVSSILIGGKLPVFKKASDEDFKDLLVSLKESASFSYTYLTLMIISTLLATTGLFANSSPVIHRCYDFSSFNGSYNIFINGSCSCRCFFIK